MGKADEAWLDVEEFEYKDMLREECGVFGMYDLDGTDIPSEDQLVAHGRTVEEIRKLIGADTLSYLEEKRLFEMAEGRPICTACFLGNYPITPPAEDIRGEYVR